MAGRKWKDWKEDRIDYLKKNPEAAPLEAPKNDGNSSVARKDTRFKVGNPGGPGRPKGARERAFEAIANGADPFDLWEAMVKGKIKASNRDRNEAARNIAERAWGKPVAVEATLDLTASLENAAIAEDTLAQLTSILLGPGALAQHTSTTLPSGSPAEVTVDAVQTDE